MFHKDQVSKGKYITYNNIHLISLLALSISVDFSKLITK